MHKHSGGIGILGIRNITKYYSTHHGVGSRKILDNVNLEVRKSEKWGIMGRNGAGKSTLIRIISGAESPNSGEIIRGISVSWPLAFGDAFQGSLTGRDNIRLIARVYGVDYRAMLKYAEEFAELGDYLGEPVKNYSSGMCARLSFAISMSIEFECYLIDEVMSVGDHRFVQKCNVDLFDKRSDRAMIIVSHQAEMIRNHCDHAAVIEDGKLIPYERVEDAINKYQSL